MTLLSIANGIVQNLSAGSVLGNFASKDYGVLDSCKDACAVVGVLRGNDYAYGFGNPNQEDLTMHIDLFLKDTGSASGILDNVLVYTEKVRNSLFVDNTLQGTVKETTGIRFSRTPGEAYIPPAGTTVFLQVRFEVDVVRFDD